MFKRYKNKIYNFFITSSSNKFVVKDLFFLPKEKKLYNFNIYDIQKLLLLLNVHGKLAIDVNIHAFIYMLRFVNEDSSYKITKNNWILIVLISYMIASKYCDDISGKSFS